jgi:hypothetical protein
VSRSTRRPGARQRPRRRPGRRPRERLRRRPRRRPRRRSRGMPRWKMTPMATVAQNRSGAPPRKCAAPGGYIATPGALIPGGFRIPPEPRMRCGEGLIGDSQVRLQPLQVCLLHQVRLLPQVRLRRVLRLLVPRLVPPQPRSRPVPPLRPRLPAVPLLAPLALLLARPRRPLRRPSVPPSTQLLLPFPRALLLPVLLRLACVLRCTPRAADPQVHEAARCRG